MRILRWLLIVIAISWFAVAWIRWTTEIPLVPVVTFRGDDELAFRGFSPAGELMLVHVRSPHGGRGRGSETGPVEFWSFPQCVKLREVFKSDDVIESLPVEPHRMTIVRREGLPWIADLETGELRHQLPRDGLAYVLARQAGPSRLLIRDGAGTRCFDFVEQREIWRLPGYGQASLIGQRYAVLRRESSGAPRAGAFQIEEDLIDLSTGTVDERFKVLEIVYYRDFSPDGRRALVMTKDQLQVIDLDSASVVWGSAEMRNAYFTAGFSQSGDELVVDSIGRDGTILTARIDASTGQVLEPGQGLKPDYMSVAKTDVTADRRFAIYDFSRDPPFLPVAWRQFQFKTSRWVAWDFPKPPERRPETVVFDMSSQRRVGFFNPRPSTVVLSPASNAFAVSKAPSGWGVSQWEVYSLPPSGNWRWFFKYVILPPGVLLVAARFCRRRRPRTDGSPQPGSTAAA